VPSKLEAALAWAARGFRVFPLPPNGTKPSSDWKGWPEHATTDPDKITAWWQGTDQNIAVCTTGMLVVDIDRKNGKNGLAAWMELHGGFDTLTVRTRSGGYHLYYSGADVALSAGVLGNGLDIRSHNGYVVAPGSVVDGLGYTVEIDQPVLPAPHDIVSRCRPPGQRTENALVPLVDLDTPAAIAAALARVQRTPGGTAGQLSEQAYKLACIVRDQGISEAMCNSIMQEWASRCVPPIAPDDLAGRIGNAYQYAQNAAGAKHPEVVFGGVHVEPPPPPPPLIPVAISWGNAIPMNALVPRPHVLRGILVRGEVTALLAPGGAGKSLLSLVIAVHLARGENFLGHDNCVGRAKSIIYNAEDSIAEMSMRLHAICTVMGVAFADVAPYIMLISGKRDRETKASGTRLRFVNGGSQPSRNDEAVQAFLALATDPALAMVSFDPLNKLHTGNGNDNVHMTFVMDVLEYIAEETDTAVLLAHHTSKGSAGFKRSGNADISQGASAVKDSARTVMTLGPPEDEDAARYALRPNERAALLRLDGAKANRGVLGSEPIWLRKKGVKLWNGEDVGALEHVTDMRGRREDMFKLIAQLGANFLMAEGKGDMASTEVVAAIAHDAMLKDYGIEGIKAALQAMQGFKIATTGLGRAGTFEVRRAGSAYRVTFM
jgi:hypothetical protein